MTYLHCGSIEAALQPLGLIHLILIQAEPLSQLQSFTILLTLKLGEVNQGVLEQEDTVKIEGKRK